jgi:hypothetical protein
LKVRTLIIFETSRDLNMAAIRKMALILGPCKTCGPLTFSAPMSEAYDAFVVGGDLDEKGLSGGLSDFLKANREWLRKKPAMLFGLTADPARDRAGLEKAGGEIKAAGCWLVASGENGPALPELVEAAMQMRAAKNLHVRTMPREELKKRVEAILQSEPYLVLCTGAGTQVRGTTIGYRYLDGVVYAFCEGSEKYANLLLNPNVCLAVWTMPEKEGLQVSGTAEIVYPGTEAYRQYCLKLGRDYNRYNNLPFQLNLVVIRLHKAEYYLAALKDEGYEGKLAYSF